MPSITEAWVEFCAGIDDWVRATGSVESRLRRPVTVCVMGKAKKEDADEAEDFEFWRSEAMAERSLLADSIRALGKTPFGSETSHSQMSSGG